MLSKWLDGDTLLEFSEGGSCRALAFLAGEGGISILSAVDSSPFVNERRFPVEGAAVDSIIRCPDWDSSFSSMCAAAEKINNYDLSRSFCSRCPQ